MNIQQALQQASQELSASSSSASLDAQVLLSFVLRCNTAHLAAWPENDLSDEQLSHYLQLIQQRKQGLPVAHLTGQREFWSLDFTVDNSTLIPRPETETLIEYVLSEFGHRKNLKLLDMGTGTGAIAIAIAKERPGWEIIASDVSKEALALARKNSEYHQANNVTFLLSNWFENITATGFDIIISNPPYIAIDDPHLKRGDVRFEPLSALTSGPEGMDDIEILCFAAADHLNDNGCLIIEHGYNQSQEVADCFIRNGFTNIRQRQDLSGHIRMTAGNL